MTLLLVGRRVVALRCVVAGGYLIDIGSSLGHVEAIIDIDDFSTIFGGGGGIRVLLNWQALRSGGFTVRERFTRSHDVLGDLMTVWYALDDGTTAEYHTRGARPLSVRAAVAQRRSWPAARQRRVLHFMRALRTQGDPVQLVLPTVETPGGHAILVDGTHRACAALIGQVDLRVLLYTLAGPVDESVLPDLIHHGVPRARSVSSVPTRR
ncbi:hypothetical protein AB0875_19475 [Micromonospora gifhornensis]|uniref:hypothetical protein n=1 Tax=Micromonospora gifhornensis TaxID=84594 RepID=UPI003456926B